MPQYIISPVGILRTSGKNADARTAGETPRNSYTMDDDAYQAYRSVVESPTLRSIWANVYGSRLWSDIDPPWTLATLMTSTL